MQLQKLLAREGQRIEKQKGEHIFMQGSSDQYLYQVESGLLKAYYSSDDGKEFIKSFLLPGDSIGSMSAAFAAGSCSFSLVCLEPATLNRIAFTTLQQHSRTDLHLANEVIELLIQFSMKKEKREYEFLCLSAEERFAQLIQSTPALFSRVTQNDLARYLGITPVALSRIKKRLNHEK